MDEYSTIEHILEKIRQENDGTHNDYLLPGYAAKKIIGYQSMRQDLILCKDALKKLFDDSIDETSASCMYYTFIALYGKCFTESSKSHYPKFEEKDFDNQEHLKESHKELMNFRHNFVAHRGSSQNEISLAYLKLNIKTLKRHVMIKQTKRIKPNSDHLPKYIELLDFLINLSEKKFYDAAVKVWDHMINSYTPEQMAALRIAGPSNRMK